MTVRIGSLFSGYGGLDQAATTVLGGTVAWYAEHEPPTKAHPKPTGAAARLLSYRHPDVPNLGDVALIDWASVEPVQVLTGGFPCQDISLAGKGLGIRPGTRSGMWTHFAYAISQLRPDLVVIENVRGLLSAAADCDLEPCPWCVGDDEGRPLRALGAVLGDLADIGYDARWHGLPASDVGAPHERFRVFVVAWPAASGGTALLGRDEDATAGGGDGPARTTGGPGVAPANTASFGRRSARRDDGVRAEGLVPLATPDPEGVGRGERRAEPAWLVGGSNAPIGSDGTAPDAHARGARGMPPRGGSRRLGQLRTRHQTLGADPRPARTHTDHDRTARRSSALAQVRRVHDGPPPWSRRRSTRPDPERKDPGHRERRLSAASGGRIALATRRRHPGRGRMTRPVEPPHPGSGSPHTSRSPDVSDDDLIPRPPVLYWSPVRLVVEDPVEALTHTAGCAIWTHHGPCSCRGVDGHTDVERGGEES